MPVGIHFHRDLASSSFCGPDLFDEEVLAKVIAASREDTHLDAPLTLAKVFTLPVFCSARNSDRKASSGQSFVAASSVSAPRGRGGDSTESRGVKQKASRLQGRPALVSLLTMEPCRHLNGGVFGSRSYVPSQQ